VLNLMLSSLLCIVYWSLPLRTYQRIVCTPPIAPHIIIYLRVSRLLLAGMKVK
jgi:hypothetical protein